LNAPWRLIVDPAGDGAWNMAVDEAILEAYEHAVARTAPTLRLYGWRPGAVSLGRSQREEGSHDPSVLTREGLDLVRRPSGGATVLHEVERTYAVVGALGNPPFARGVIATYRAIADALACGLRGLGVPAEAAEPRRQARGNDRLACFERVGEWEIVAAGRKLVGSAQARRRKAVLQHGSVPLRLDPSRLEAVLGRPVDGSRFIDLERAIGSAVDETAVDAAIIRGFETAFGAQLLKGVLDETEALRAAELRCWKYDSIAWTRGGAIGLREARWGPAVAR
jgi:lipoate-protein ligase A